MGEEITRGSEDWGAGRLDPAAEARFVEGVEYCGRFFVGMAEAQKALYKLVDILEAEGVVLATRVVRPRIIQDPGVTVPRDRPG